jgi:mono/diheme cytochrome c family protein
MNKQEQEEYLEEYKQEKEKGVPFFPDIVFKDSVAALLVFIVLVAMAFFVGAALEEQANPADTEYTPKPEWYFLFLFQLLKYFPGELEFIGVVVVPTIAILLLLFLPFLDRSSKRHYRSRPVVTIATTLVMVGIIVLSIVALREAPPPVEAAEGDKTAALYAENCAGCHGRSIDVGANTNLHEIIAQGNHEGMPAWTADLSTDEIDALAGFVLSPAGSDLFNQECSRCHAVQQLVASDPAELKSALDLGIDYSAHSMVEIPDWTESLSSSERTALLNFLVAPDGQRLFATNCASCHGRSIGFPGEEAELLEVIREGGLHLEMPPWREKLSENEIGTLALYVVDPTSVITGEALYNQHCKRCHADTIPNATDYVEAKEIISSGGAHETMPVWGEILTDDQLEALVLYTVESAEGTPIESGRLVYSDNCSDCHGDLGEGGSNPARPGDIIAPISTAEYLRTRDDGTINSIISQGQPNFGMSPFGSAFGGPLDDDEIDNLVAYIRSWEADPPVELPPEVTFDTVALSGFEIFSEICAQCHGVTGRGITGPSLRDSNFRNTNSSQDLFNTVSEGHQASDMIAWGSILSSEQIVQLVEYIEGLPIDEAGLEPVPEDSETEEQAEETESEEVEEPAEEVETEPEPEGISFSAELLPMIVTAVMAVLMHPLTSCW